MQCSVCLDKISTDKEEQIKLGCRHTFHSDCVLLWLLEKATCPLCRTPATETELNLARNKICVLCKKIKPELSLVEPALPRCNHHFCAGCTDKYWKRPTCPVCFPRTVPSELDTEESYAIVAQIMTNIHRMSAFAIPIHE